VPREYALAQARYAYLWDRYEDGREFVRSFFDAYKELKILDDHFLYVRGLPFFERWWATLAAFSILSDDLSELEEVTEYVARHCFGYDFDHLRLELVAHRDDKPELLIPPFEKRLKEIETSGFPTGYTRMNIAVAKARSASNAWTARDALGGVYLDGRDFPWLEDIRTLARAEIAHRFNEPEKEREHVATFLARQPMLFEPDIALNFHLLPYQELLKPFYRDGAKPGTPANDRPTASRDPR